MRSNSIKTCAVGAMLFGGTLGAASTAYAGLTFTHAGVAPTLNYARNDSTLNYLNSETNRGFSAFSASIDGLDVAWSATTGSGFSTTVSPSASLSYLVTTRRNFSVTGSQEVTFSWSGSQSLILGLASGSGYTTVSGLGAGWGTNTFGSFTDAASGSVTITLGAGNYRIYSDLGDPATTGPSFFSFTVPAPGAAALVGVAGLMARRRRN